MLSKKHVVALQKRKFRRGSLAVHQLSWIGEKYTCTHGYYARLSKNFTKQRRNQNATLACQGIAEYLQIEVVAEIGVHRNDPETTSGL